MNYRGNENMTEIAPSILSADFANLREEVEKVKTAKYLHFDIMDGNYVPNITFGPGILKSIRPYSKQIFDTHLMLKNPEKYNDTFAKAGSDIITVHIEIVKHLDSVIEQIKKAGCKAGVALNPATHLSNIEYILEKLDLVLLMTVNPGFGGQEFIPYMYKKIRNLREIIDKRNLKVKLEIDGGVNAFNIKKIADTGVDIIVAGSAIFENSDPAKILGKLSNIIAF